MPVALITAGGNGMGSAAARCLIEMGWRVVLTDTDAVALEKAAAAAGGGAALSTTVLEFTDLDACKAVSGAVAAAHGGIDGLVNLGGGQRRLGIPRGEFMTSNAADWQRIIDANLKSVMNCCYAALPHMIAAGKGGAIVNVTANKGLRGGPRNAIYSAAKAGVILFGQALAQEVGEHKIRVNAVTPGQMESDGKGVDAGDTDPSKIPLGRPTAPGDLGNMIAFLLSNEADFITGCCLDCSGGVALH